MFTKLVDHIIKSPGIKTLIFIVSTIISGILSAAFIYELSSSGRIRWNLFYKTGSFYLILGWIVMIYIYNYHMYKKESDISKFKDDDYCTAYIRSQCLPEIAAKYKETIKSGNISNLRDITAEIKRIME